MSKLQDTTKQKYFGVFKDRETIIDKLARSSCADEPEKVRQEWLNNNPLFPKEEEILVASYEYEDYNGSAFLLFKRDGKLYEYNDRHCSCNGLEDAVFYASNTSWEALAMRDPEGELYGYGAHCTEAIDLIKALVEKNRNNPHLFG